MNKKTVIVIEPGPIFRPKLSSYQDKYHKLSRYYDGYILTTSSDNHNIHISDFELSAFKSNKSFISNILFIVYCVRRALFLRKQNKHIDIVISYDPLKEGFIALLISRILHAKFITEVNGVYTSSAVWEDSGNKISVKVKMVLYSWVMVNILKRADGIKLLFDTQIDQFKKYTQNAIVRTYPEYVDIDVFKNICEEKIVLLVGFPYKCKGVDIMIKAFKKVAPLYPDWRLKILGWYTDLTQLNNEIAGHPQIFHKKPVHYQEMPDEIGRCGIVVQPSRSEAMGRVLVEAMAAGKPRIGSNVDGIPTVINDGHDGLLVKPGDVDDLAEKLNMLLSDVSLRKRLGENASKRAHTEFTKDIYADNVRNFFYDVVG